MKDNYESTNRPLVTIIVPVYNQAQNIEVLYRSISSQTWSNIEIIFVNDGSTDASLARLNSLKAEDSRVSIITQENAGLSAARNSGLRCSTGQFITFLDGDDHYMSSDAIRSTIKRMKETKSQIGIFGYALVMKDSGSIRRIRHVGEELSTAFSGVWNKIYDRKLFENVNFPEGFYYEDIELTPRLYSRANRVTVIDKPYVAYMQSSDSIVRVSDSNRHADAFVLVNTIVTSNWFARQSGSVRVSTFEYAVSQFVNHTIVNSDVPTVSEHSLQTWEACWVAINKEFKNTRVSRWVRIQSIIAHWTFLNRNSFLGHMTSYLLNGYRNSFRR